MVKHRWAEPLEFDAASFRACIEAKLGSIGTKRELMAINSVREILGYPPIEGGDALVEIPTEMLRSIRSAK